MSIGKDKKQIAWLSDTLRYSVINEVTGEVSLPLQRDLLKNEGKLTISQSFHDAGITSIENWQAFPDKIELSISFTSIGKNAGHEIIIDLPVINKNSKIFTPSERGVIDVKYVPDYCAPRYGERVFSPVSVYTMPLVSIFNEEQDNAITFALPPDQNIPYFFVEWTDARNLRLHFKHVRIGDSIPAPLRLIIYTHPADYRSVLARYMEDYPDYFKSDLPRSDHEGVFWYHHIHDYPPVEEIKKQNARFVWMSFYNEWIGNFLPEKESWYPYTYARQWSFKQKCDDNQINKYIQEMKKNDISVFAYFNLTDYGGGGGKDGSQMNAHNERREKFPDANVYPENDTFYYSWENSVVMNANPKLSYWPHLKRQFQQHLERLKGFDGFIFDRFDWASLILDYRQNDGYTMVGDRPVENLSNVIAGVMPELCSMAHEKGKSVYVNAAWRVELLKKVDGFCCEAAYLPAQAYLTTNRLFSAWIDRECYGDMVKFESQLKQFLLYGVFPQMICSKYQISQQEANPQMAQLLEIYSPLFSKYNGKEQILSPHCIETSSTNSVNLFMNKDKHYIVPVISRNRFMALKNNYSEKTTVDLRIKENNNIKWAHVYSPDTLPYRSQIELIDSTMRITLKHHSTVSVIELGSDNEPNLNVENSASLYKIKNNLYPCALPKQPSINLRPVFSDARAEFFVQIEGRKLGYDSKVFIEIDRKELSIDGQSLEYSLGRIMPSQPPSLSFIHADEGTWFVPVSVKLIAKTTGNNPTTIAEWNVNDKITGSGQKISLQLHWKNLN